MFPGEVEAYLSGAGYSECQLLASPIDNRLGGKGFLRTNTLPYYSNFNLNENNYYSVSVLKLPNVVKLFRDRNLRLFITN
jgi:hypothetical protein